MFIDGYEVTQTKRCVMVIKDDKVVYMKPKRKEYSNKELEEAYKDYKDRVTP